MLCGAVESVPRRHLSVGKRWLDREALGLEARGVCVYKCSYVFLVFCYGAGTKFSRRRQLFLFLMIMRRNVVENFGSTTFHRLHAPFKLKSLEYLRRLPPLCSFYIASCVTNGAGGFELVNDITSNKFGRIWKSSFIVFCPDLVFDGFLSWCTCISLDSKHSQGVYQMILCFS